MYEIKIFDRYVVHLYGGTFVNIMISSPFTMLKIMFIP